MNENNNNNNNNNVDSGNQNSTNNSMVRRLSPEKDTNITFDLNNDYLDIDIVSDEAIEFNQTLQDDLLEKTKGILSVSKSGQNLTKTLESLLMDSHLERNFYRIMEMINNISQYELSNYIIEETEASFLHLAVNRRISEHANEEVLLEIVRNLLDKRCNINAIDIYGWTPFHYCCASNLTKIVGLILDNGLIKQDTLNSKSMKQIKISGVYYPIGTTPLHICAWSNHLELAKVLVEHGANINDVNDSGWTCLHICSQMAHVDFLNYLIIKGSNINKLNFHQKTPLHISTSYGNEQIAKILLESSADITLRNNYGQTPLFVAVLKGHLNLTKLLLRYKSNTNIGDNQENNCLHACAFLPERDNETSNSSGICEDEHHTGDVNAKMSAKNIEIAKLLLQNSCDLLKRNNLGRTALHYCAKNNHTSLAALLISESHSLINIRDIYGQTSLMISCSFRSIETQRLLLQKNANKDIHDLSGISPIHLCALHSYDKLLFNLLEYGDDVNKLMAKQNCDSCLHLAVKKNNFKMVSFLIDNHADVNIVNKLEQTPLHYSCLYGAYESCCVLLNRGAKVNVQDHKGQTPLHLAIFSVTNSIRLAKILIDNGANINQEDNEFNNCLSLSTIHGNYDILKFLINKKAKIMNSNYESVVHMCAIADKCSVECLNLLIRTYGINPLFNYSLTNYQTPLQLCVELKSLKFLKSLISCDSISCSDWYERLHSTKGLGVSPLVMSITCQNFEFVKELVDLWNLRFNHTHHLKASTENHGHGCVKCHNKDLCLFKPNYNDPEQSSEKYFLNILIRENEELTVEILNTFVKTDILKWETYIFLDHLEPCENLVENSVSKFERPLTPIETIFVYDKTNLITHPVVVNLIKQKYYDFAKKYFWADTVRLVFLVIIWTLFLVHENYSLRHYYDGSNRTFKIILLVLLILGFIWDLYTELDQVYFTYRRILGFKKYIKLKYELLKNSETYEDKSKDSIVNHIKANEERFELEQFNLENEANGADDKNLKKIIKDDCFIINSSKTNKYCLVEKEARAAINIPMPYNNSDNLIDWITCGFQLASLIFHCIDVFDHNDVYARMSLGLILITLLLMWLRQFLNINGVFPGVKLVCMFRIIGSSIFSYGCLYSRIYFAFMIVFYFLYRGTHVPQSAMLNNWKHCEAINYDIYPRGDHSNRSNSSLINNRNLSRINEFNNYRNICRPNITVKGYESFYSSLFSVFRIIVQDSYDFENMKLVHEEIAPFLVSIFIVVNSLIGLNFFIGLMTNVLTVSAFKSVESHMLMNLLGYVLMQEWRLSKRNRQKHLNKIRKHCSPLVLTGEKVILSDMLKKDCEKREYNLHLYDGIFNRTEEFSRKEKIHENSINKITYCLNELSSEMKSLKDDLNEIKYSLKHTLSGNHDIYL